MGEGGSCRAWIWFGGSLSLPVQSKLPLALARSGLGDLVYCSKSADGKSLCLRPANAKKLAKT